MRINETDWNEFIGTFRSDLEKVDDMWKDCERSYRDDDGDIINFRNYSELHVWRITNIISFALDWENCVFFEEDVSCSDFARKLIDDVYDWSETAELNPYEYEQTDEHLELFSMLINGLNEEDPEVSGIKPMVIKRFNEYFPEYPV